jgi:hypothetical protein
VSKIKSTIDQIKEAAEADLLTFIRLIAPHRVLSKCHEDVIRWWTRDEAKKHQLLLYPRDHQKSAMVAYRVAWEITRNPSTTVLYISSTANLAEKQLKFIKDILTSPKYIRYWPEMVNQDEGKRAKWTNSEIEVDHPIRKREGVRDPTIFTAGLTTSITGLHCNIAVLDDVVVQENAYTKEGREKVKEQYSLLASIETTDAREWVVGTRYHLDDLYGNMLEMLQELYDETGNVISKEPIYEILQREVEDRGDGTGDYLWPRLQRSDGRWFGFNQEILATKRAQYLDKDQFRAQYYNDPSNSENEVISSDYFQYYDKAHVEQSNGKWFVRGRAINIFASIDFAFSLNAGADFTALVIIGVDSEGNIYVLDIDRFKTNKITQYYEHIYAAYAKWGFRKIRAEVTVAQEAIVEDLKDRIRENGIALSIDKFRPMKQQGTKEERIDAILKPRYENLNIWHYRSGMCEELEIELRSKRPKHDDIKDALANAVAIMIVPKNQKKDVITSITTHSRFGGVAR